jgi:hypothetical protein
MPRSATSSSCPTPTNPTAQVKGRPFAFCWRCLQPWGKQSEGNPTRCDKGNCDKLTRQALLECPSKVRCPVLRICFSTAFAWRTLEIKETVDSTPGATRLVWKERVEGMGRAKRGFATGPCASSSEALSEAGSYTLFSECRFVRRVCLLPQKRRGTTGRRNANDRC